MERKALEDLGLEKEAIDKVLNLHHSELEPLKEKVAAKDIEISKLNESNKETQKSIDELAKKAGGNDELQKAFEDFKAEAEQKENAYKQDIKKRDFDALLTSEITKRGGKSIVKKLINYDEFAEVENANEAVAKALDDLRGAEDTKVLFEPVKVDETNVGGSKLGESETPATVEMPAYF